MRPFNVPSLPGSSTVPEFVEMEGNALRAFFRTERKASFYYGIAEWRRIWHDAMVKQDHDSHR